METIKIFEEAKNIRTEIERLKDELEKSSRKKNLIKNQCSHEIVFKYTDNYPKKMMIDGNYICPACRKNIKCFEKGQIQTTAFKNSRIIPLTNLSLIGNIETISTIINEVYNNIDIYYDYSIPTEKLSNLMETVLEDKQSKYEKSKTLKKRKIN